MVGGQVHDWFELLLDTCTMEFGAEDSLKIFHWYWKTLNCVRHKKSNNRNSSNCNTTNTIISYNMRSDNRSISTPRP